MPAACRARLHWVRLPFRACSFVAECSQCAGATSSAGARKVGPCRTSQYRLVRRARAWHATCLWPAEGCVRCSYPLAHLMDSRSSFALLDACLRRQTSCFRNCRGASSGAVTARCRRVGKPQVATSFHGTFVKQYVYRPAGDKSQQGLDEPTRQRQWPVRRDVVDTRHLSLRASFDGVQKSEWDMSQSSVIKVGNSVFPRVNFFDPEPGAPVRSWMSADRVG